VGGAEEADPLTPDRRFGVWEKPMQQIGCEKGGLKSDRLIAGHTSVRSYIYLCFETVWTVPPYLCQLSVIRTILLTFPSLQID